MRKSVSLIAAVVFACLAATAAAQQQPPAPRPARGMSEEILGAWNDVGRKIIAMAEDFPEEKYSYKPTPEVRSFAQLVQHIAAVNYFFTNAAAGREVEPAADDPPAGKYKTKAEIVAFVKKSFADGADAIRQKGNAGMAATLKHPFANQMASLQFICFGIIEHSGEHYGNLVVYYRLNGMVPPESRPRR